MKKAHAFISAPLLALFALLLSISCSTGQGSSTTDGASKNAISIAPKLNLSVPVASSKRSVSNPGAAFTLGEDFDASHAVFVKDSDWDLYQIKAASPVFDGFEATTLYDGDVFVSDFFGRKVTTVVHVDENGNATFDGAFNDGGWYEMTLNANGTYSFSQYIIFDIINYDAGKAYSDTGYVTGALRRASYARAWGTVSKDSSGQVVSDGEYITHLMIMGLSNITWTVNGPTDVVFSNPAFTIFDDRIEMYHANMKTRPGFFGVRNYKVGVSATVFAGMVGLGYFPNDLRANCTYSNAVLRNTLRDLNDAEAYPLSGSNFEMDLDYMYYNLNDTGWKYMNHWYSMPWTSDSVEDMDTIWNR